MADLTPIFSDLLESRGADHTLQKENGRPEFQLVDEFLKEAHRINSHISSLLAYLKSIRQPYLTTTPALPASRRQAHHAAQSDHFSSNSQLQQHLTDQDRDSIDSSTATLFRELSSSITNLASAETLRQETQSSLLRKKYGQPNGRLWRWAGGGGPIDTSRSAEQEEEEDGEKTIKTVRENVLWFLRRNLEGVAEVQRGMVEKRIERVREKEKSVLYKTKGMGQIPAGSAGGAAGPQHAGHMEDVRIDDGMDGAASMGVRDISLDEKEAAAIESQLSPEQLQLFAEENDNLLKYYEDTLSKVQNAEKSLIEISSLQQTLVGHLATQEDYINQLVTDAMSTHANVGQGNKELKKASERRSTAQAVFWGTVGLCTSLVIWDAIF